MLLTGRLHDCLNHTRRTTMLPDMLMQNQITRHLYQEKYRNMFQNVFCRILVTNRFSMLLHRFITTFQINVDILENSHLRKNSKHMKEEVEREISSSTTHYLVKILKPILQKDFSLSWIKILVKIINIARFSIAIMLKLVIVAWMT